VSAKPNDRSFLTPSIGISQFARWKRKMCAKPRDRVSFTVTTIVDIAPSLLSAARVAAPSSEKQARMMRFRIAKLLIKLSWVNYDKSRLFFQIPRNTTFQNKFPARSSNGRSWLSLPRTREDWLRTSKEVALARTRVQRRRPRVYGQTLDAVRHTTHARSVSDRSACANRVVRVILKPRASSHMQRIVILISFARRFRTKHRHAFVRAVR